MLSCFDNKSKNINITDNKTINKMDTITLGTGCFWCSEAIFQDLKGVISVNPGYSGGLKYNPTYNEVCSGETGHAEVVQIVFDSTIISLTDLLGVFWQIHDPTTLNRQGADIGTQYRSVIFYHNISQKETAEKLKDDLIKSGSFKNSIVTEITAFERFYKAEEYHQNYYKQNPNQSYCTFVIGPKMEKFRKIFKNKLK